MNRDIPLLLPLLDTFVVGTEVGAEEASWYGIKRHTQAHQGSWRFRGEIFTWDNWLPEGAGEKAR